jgi:hypothetical protein
MDKIVELFDDSGFVAIVSAVITALVSFAFNAWFEKQRQKQYFINQILPERMKAHGAVLEILAATLEKVVHSSAMQTAELPGELLKQAKEFHAVYSRNIVWLDEAVRDYCDSIYGLFVSAVIDKTQKYYTKKELNAEERANLLASFVAYHALIQKRVASTSGIPLLERYLSKISVKKVGKKIRQPRKNDY